MAPALRDNAGVGTSLAALARAATGGAADAVAALHEALDERTVVATGLAGDDPGGPDERGRQRGLVSAVST